MPISKMLISKMERDDSHTTPIVQDETEILQGMVRDQITQILTAEFPQILNEEEFLKFRTSFLLALSHNPMAAAQFLNPETQRNLTQYAQQFLMYKAKSHNNQIQNGRIQQLTTLLNGAWYTGSDGVFITYKTLQEKLYQILGNVKEHLSALFTFAQPAHKQALLTDSKVLKDILTHSRTFSHKVALFIFLKYCDF